MLNYVCLSSTVIDTTLEINTDLFKLVTAVIRVWIITIIIYVTFREPNGTLDVTTNKRHPARYKESKVR
jgi:hypothetical protein